MSKTGKAALHAFALALDNGDGNVGTAVAYDALHGWRVALRTGDSLMFLNHSDARKLGDKFATHAPSGPAHDTARELGQSIVDCSNECRIKNRDRVVPDGYAEILPTRGNA